MIGSIIINSELEIVRLRDKKVLTKVVFDVERIPEDELLWIIRTYKILRRRQKSKGKCTLVNQDYREVYREVEKIVNKATVGGRIKPFALGALDPALGATPPLIIGLNAAADLGLAWCDYGAPGKLFTGTFCTNPNTFNTRRAIALNPWSLSEPGDLDTIIDTAGYHKRGSIGTSPFTISRNVTKSSATLLATFVAANDTTIASIVLVAATHGAPGHVPSCNPDYPIPDHYCLSGTGVYPYQSAYIPLWGWDVNRSITKGEAYAVRIKFYV